MELGQDRFVKLIQLLTTEPLTLVQLSKLSFSGLKVLAASYEIWEFY